MTIIKLTQTPSSPNKTNYIGALHLGSVNLDFMKHPEGRYDYATSKCYFKFTYHLGNGDKLGQDSIFIKKASISLEKAINIVRKIYNIN